MDVEELKQYISEDGLLHVIVKPNAPHTELLEWDSARAAVRIAVAGVPDKDKANLELIKYLSKLLKAKIAIVRGSKSREKTLQIRHI